MSCDHWQAAISARIDGEDLGVEPRLLDAHLARCASCRSFEAAVSGSLHPVRLEEAATMPDISGPITKFATAADRAAALSAPRVLLGVVAVEVLVLSLRSLVLGSSSDAFAHATRHLGAFSFAYGVGLLVVVLRPARARAMLPVAAVLAGALAITAVIDMANGTVPFLGEVIHLPELVSVLLIWLLAVPGPRRAQRAQRTGGESDRGLHAA
jgi:predicted anti-sigma-YlaC factor YlaD